MRCCSDDAWDVLILDTIFPISKKILVENFHNNYAALRWEKRKKKKKPNDGTANLHKNSSLAYIAVHVIINNRLPVRTHTRTHTRTRARSTAINNAVGLVRIPGYRSHHARRHSPSPASTDPCTTSYTSSSSPSVAPPTPPKRVFAYHASSNQSPDLINAPPQKKKKIIKCIIWIKILKKNIAFWLPIMTVKI